jgi:alcohol dehydrogenase class IV
MVRAAANRRTEPEHAPPALFVHMESRVTEMQPFEVRFPARVVAAAAGVDAIVAVGGGSSLDCAKGIDFVLTNGGTMRDDRGYGEAARPLLPMVGVPTTAGTGSDAQARAIISDAEPHPRPGRVIARSSGAVLPVVKRSCRSRRGANAS